MAITNGGNQRWRKFLLPGAASVLGAGAGLALSRTNKLKDALPSLDNVGIGDLTDDLRSKVSSVVGKAESSRSGGSSRSRSARALDSGELEQRLRDRAQRRKQRAGR